MDITPLERRYLIEFLVEDFKQQREVKDAYEAARKDSRRK